MNAKKSNKHTRNKCYILFMNNKDSVVDNFLAQAILHVIMSMNINFSCGLCSDVSHINSSVGENLSNWKKSWNLKTMNKHAVRKL